MNNILILHGWGSRAENWSRVKELLENQGYKVFVPDLPGFGENSPLSRAWAIDDYVEWVSEFCEKNNLSQFFLLGHSFGGAVAVKFSLKYPEKVKKMFLVASSGIRRKTIKKEILKKIANFLKFFSFLPFYSSIRKIFYKIVIQKSDYPYTEGIMKETYLKIINEDISSCFSEVSVPTIIIWGDKDDVLPVENAYFINQKIKNSDLVIIPGVNHDLERKVPEILAEKIKEFLSDEK